MRIPNILETHDGGHFDRKDQEPVKMKYPRFRCQFVQGVESLLSIRYWQDEADTQQNFQLKFSMSIMIRHLIQFYALS